MCAGYAKVDEMLALGVFTCLLIVGACSAQGLGGAGEAQRPPALRGAGVLLSWQNPKGGWNFCIFEWVLGRSPTLEDVRQYPVLQGIGDLQRRIASLPRGYILSWQDQRILDPSYGSSNERERLAVPPPPVVADVKRFADAHQVKVVVPDPPQGVQRK